VHASYEALTLHSPVAYPGSPWLTLLARCECLKRHGVGEREGELGADFSSILVPKRGPSGSLVRRTVGPRAFQLKSLRENARKTAYIKFLPLHQLETGYEPGA